MKRRKFSVKGLLDTLDNFLNVDLQDTEIKYLASLGLIALLLMTSGQML